MALDSAKNFAKTTLSTGYDAAALSVVLVAGQGAKLPTAPFNVVWWDSTTYSDPSDDPNVEICRVTVIATDTLTITRAQEGTSASTKNTGGKTYKMIAGLTAKVINTDIFAQADTYYLGLGVNSALSLPDITGNNGKVLGLTAGALAWVTGAGGSQTPWTSAINGGGYSLSNVNSITANTMTLGTVGGANGQLTINKYGTVWYTTDSTGLTCSFNSKGNDYGAQLDCTGNGSVNTLTFNPSEAGAVYAGSAHGNLLQDTSGNMSAFNNMTVGNSLITRFAQVYGYGGSAVFGVNNNGLDNTAEFVGTGGTTYVDSLGNLTAPYLFLGTNPTVGNLLKYTANGVVDSGSATPSGTIVGTTDSQSLTNKDLTDSTNTFPKRFEFTTALSMSNFCNAI